MIEYHADKDNDSIRGSSHAFKKKIKNTKLKKKKMQTLFSKGANLNGVVALYFCMKTYFNSEV